MRRDTYAGFEHYWITADNHGAYQVMQEGYNDNDIVFTGKYTDCIRYIDQQVCEALLDHLT